LKKFNKPYFRRKAQGYVEYLSISLIILVVAIFAFPDLFRTVADTIARSAPAYRNNSALSYTAVLGQYSNEFITEYRTMVTDPSTAGCAGEITTALAVISGSGSDIDAALANDMRLKMINLIGSADATGTPNVTAADLLSPACQANPAVDSVETVLEQQLVNIDLSEETCSDTDEVCTVTTIANAIGREMVTLIDSGTISKDIFLSHTDSPVTSIGMTTEEILKKYYYVGPDSDNPYTNYKNIINLIDQAAGAGQLTAEMAEVYDVLKSKLGDATVVTNDKTTTITDEIAHPEWEAVPFEIVTEPTTNTTTVTTTTPTTTTTTVSEPPKPPPPPFYFCGPPGELKKFLE